MSLAEELTMLRKRVKDQDKEIRRLKEENEFLEEASAFFAASRRKSLRKRHHLLLWCIPRKNKSYNGSYSKKILCKGNGSFPV